MGTFIVVVVVLFIFSKIFFGKGAKKKSHDATLGAAARLGVPDIDADRILNTKMESDLAVLLSATAIRSCTISHLPVHERMAHCVKIVYDNEEKAKHEIVTMETLTKLKHFLKNQIDTLAQEESTVCINEITMCYISHLVMMITKKPVSIIDIRDLMSNVFTDETSVALIYNACDVFQRDPQIEEKLDALFLIVKEEYEAGYGEFLIRHTRKVQEWIKERPKRDPFRDMRLDPPWTAKDLA